MSRILNSAPFAELIESALLGCAAMRANRRRDYDAAKIQFTNHAPANQFLRKEYRKGFGV